MHERKTNKVGILTRDVHLPWLLSEHLEHKIFSLCGRTSIIYHTIIYPYFTFARSLSRFDIKYDLGIV
jgi:hypothetical protein